MSDKKNIDRLFQEAFKNFEATPSDAVWNNIEAKLNQKKDKRRVIPIWWRYAGVAALLLLLLTVGNSFFGESDVVIPSNQVVDTEDTTRSSVSETATPENNATNSVVTENNNGLENASETETNSKASVVAEKASENDKVENEIKTNSTLKNKSKSIIKSDKRNAIAKNSDGNISNNKQTKTTNSNDPSELILDNKTTDNAVITENSEKENNSTKDAFLDKTKTDNVINNIKKNNAVVSETEKTDHKTIAENKESNKVTSIEDILNETKDIIEEEERLNRWSVTPNAAPVYFNTLGEGSSIDSQFNNNTKTAETNMSYGISASYAVNKKLSIRSGINKVNLGYNTNNVVVYETIAKSASSSLVNNASAVKTSPENTNTPDNITLVSAENFEASKAGTLVSNSNTSINQSFVYIEVPLEIQYMLSDKKLGVNVIGGFSSFFLSDNELFSDFEGSRTSIGEATNINKVSYSANLGLGFQYKFSKKLNLNLEPMFKYQINTFNNTSGNFTPYFIGVYTGIGFKF
jgi:hypothetical protein